jgi:hypothetical protein
VHFNTGVASGGVVSLFVALAGFSVSNLDWMGASSAGIVEEIGKLLAGRGRGQDI